MKPKRYTKEQVRDNEHSQSGCIVDQGGTKNANGSQVVLGQLFVLGQSRKPLRARSRTLCYDVFSDKVVVSTGQYCG